VDNGGVAQVVEAVSGEDLGSSLEPGGLSEGDAGVLGQQLGGQAPQSSEHGLQVRRCVGQARCVLLLLALWVWLSPIRVVNVLICNPPDKWLMWGGGGDTRSA